MTRRFAPLRDVVEHYNNFSRLELTEGEELDLSNTSNHFKSEGDRNAERSRGGLTDLTELSHLIACDRGYSFD